jgi:hypothetical protein
MWIHLTPPEEGAHSPSGQTGLSSSSSSSSSSSYMAFHLPSNELLSALHHLKADPWLSTV